EGIVFVDPADAAAAEATAASSPYPTPNPSREREGSSLRKLPQKFLDPSEIEGANSGAIENSGADDGDPNIGVAAALHQAADREERSVLSDNAPAGRIVFSEKF